MAATRWGTRPEQRTVRTTLAGLAEADIASPSVLVIGAVAGTAAALLAGRSVGSLLFHMEGRDATVTVGALVLVIAVALLAAWVPALRASHTDPMRALRQE